MEFSVKKVSMHHCSILCRAAESLNTLANISILSKRIVLNFGKIYSEGEKDQVESQNSDPEALQFSMQHCRISKHSSLYLSHF